MDSELIHGLENLKRLREEESDIGSEIFKLQNDMLPLIRKEDPEREGVSVKVDGVPFLAKWQQNKAPENWDLENLIPYLKKKRMWDKVSTEILDQAKLEAEIRAGNISIRELQGFKVKGNTPRAFIRFDEIKRRIVRRRRKKL